MRKITYEQINETLYTEVLDNGLTVYLLPKAGYHKTYGLFSTNYGSLDNTFVPIGQTDFVTVPDGIAHFLEHKLFEKEAGDVFQVFGKQGASANAFTSFTKTSYLFSATDQIRLNLETLLDFVQEPYFTKESVDKEKGIIGQEIGMYQDDPYFLQFSGLLAQMYPNHPLAVDILGTVETIDKITAEDLYLCYRTFYQPSNMKLLVVGNIDPDEVMSWIKANQGKKEFPKATPIQRKFPQENLSLVKEASRKLPLSRSKGALGVKGLVQDLPKEPGELLRFRYSLNLLFALLLGNTSSNYLRLYDEGVIDDSFGFEYDLDREFSFGAFFGDSDRPEAMIQEIQTILLNFATDSEVNEANLTLLKKKMLGKYFQSLNSLEYIANQFTQSIFGDLTVFDVPDVIDSITLADVLAAGKTLIKEEAFCTYYLYPEEEI
ncbi:M16 family metallopeptidase [Enterococcus sp. 2201sp1_2201st1_B8_2201SCRN_220225]|uniref:EF-P 5-aminopentanol modification-associated protein YfmH n=1 Tax=unclassified Enterococcus TaxID=2608891 RepID=UPI0034A32231